MVLSSPNSVIPQFPSSLPRRRFFSPSFLPLSHPALAANHPAEMKPDCPANSSVMAVLFGRVMTVTLFLAAIVFSCFVLYRGVDSVGLKLPASYHFQNPLPVALISDSRRTDRDNNSLERVLTQASMPDKTVILTTLNEAWASPNSIVDLFLESFRIGVQTRRLLNHLVILALDQKAYSRCLDIHMHCFALITEGVNSSTEAYFMTPEYLKMMWNRIHFLKSVLEMGFNFVFTDADIMWFRDPFPHFYADADFQIACDHFIGDSDDLDNIPNGGFNFVRSNNQTIEFYKLWYLSRELYPGLHDQDVLNKIKNDTLVQDIGINIKFLSTAYFGGFCEPSKDLNEVCTMHANCCFGLDSKLHDLRILLKEWKSYMALPPRLKGPSLVSWTVPQNCSLDAFVPFNVSNENDTQQIGFG
ncbi:OLC1v1033068C1 [Oldenlandia corymbosa var. corymbosa]|uniref:Glycosyltransferase n=1 Tax=Oldenlandia corymbosa var. corymbosa TaxID=529605 RepID=A0AAV1CP88_OLDCO|nr:OLC1v1033068C1 [Oldenlandia corymbosa var. corymbosa]